MPTSNNLDHTTSARNIEQALQDSQARLAAIIASAMDGIITIDESQRIILCNKAAEEMFGYSAEDLLGESIELLIPARYRQRHHKDIARFGETGITNRHMGRLGTLYGLRANGQEFPIEASISQVELAEGRLYSVILRDISERVRADETIRESEQHMRATFEQAAVGIAHMTTDGYLLRFNQKMCEITGYGSEDLQRMNFRNFTHPDDITQDLVLHEELLAGKVETYTREKRYLRKDGSIVWVNLTASLVRDINGLPKYFIKVMEDITERKENESRLQVKNDEIKTMTQQLWQTAKLATMGELAASIAHELNNPLAILSLRIESLLSGADPASSEFHELEIMEREVERMASLVTNLLQFSRSNERQISSLDIREEVDRTLELVHTYLVNRHVTAERIYAANLPLIQADRQQLRQLFLNLFTNASDAMPQGGELTIKLQPVHDRKNIQIEVRDTGVGIPLELMHQVMEPFYTTKAEGKGTGLGLSICRRIVEEHQGNIRILSPGPNQGTIIQIVLPSACASGYSFLEE
jgi:PAS domain S-box-containing protein